MTGRPKEILWEAAGDGERQRGNDCEKLGHLWRLRETGRPGEIL